MTFVITSNTDHSGKFEEGNVPVVILLALRFFGVISAITVRPP